MSCPELKLLKHNIDIDDHPPIKQSAYRVNPSKRKVMEEEVKYLVENGLAVPSSCVWSFTMLTGPKSDCTQRFCMDYRKVKCRDENQISFPSRLWRIV